MANNPLTHRELSSFFDQIAMLLDAGIPVAEGIGIMIEHADNQASKEILDIIFSQMDKGERFSTAMKATQAFPDYAVNMIAVGEFSGHLDRVSRELSTYYVQQEDIQSSIRSAVRYPLIMLVLLMVVLLVIVVEVLPVFQEVFQSLGAEMNQLALSLVSLGDWMSRYAVGLVMTVALFALLAFVVARSDRFKAGMMRFFHKFPFTKSIAAHLEQARFSQILSMTMESGIEISKSLEMAQQILTNPLYTQKANVCLDKVNSGESFGDSLIACGIFGSMDCQLIRIAFKSGNFDTSLRKIALRHLRLAEDEIGKKISLIEPALVGIFSILVGIILFSVIFPLVGIMASFG